MSASVANLAAYAGRMRRINLLRAHGSPARYLYAHHGCRCVVCRAAQAEYTRQWRADHLEQKAASDRKYRVEHHEETAEYNHNRRPKHPEKEAERSRKHRAGHREEVSAYNHEYRTDHPEEMAAKDRNRRALEANATGTHSAAFVRAQYERQRGKCFWRKVNPACAVSLKGGYHVDHVIPLAGDRTSSNGPENIVLTCPKCNGSKHAKDPMDWAGVMF